MGSEECSPFLLFLISLRFFFFFCFFRFSSLLFFLRFSSLFSYAPRGKKGQITAIYCKNGGISLRPRLHRPRAELPEMTVQYGKFSKRSKFTTPSIFSTAGFFGYLGDCSQTWSPQTCPVSPYPLNLGGDISPSKFRGGPQENTVKQGISDTPPQNVGGESAT